MTTTSPDQAFHPDCSDAESRREWLMDRPLREFVGAAGAAERLNVRSRTTVIHLGLFVADVVNGGNLYWIPDVLELADLREAERKARQARTSRPRVPGSADRPKCRL